MAEDQTRAYYNWYCDYVDKVNKHNRAVQDVTLKFISVILENESKVRKKYEKKKYWEAELFKKRSSAGFYSQIYPILKQEGRRFYNYFRLTSSQFEELIELIGPCIKRHRETAVRKPISVGERLALTFRYLASGDSMISLSYAYLIGKSTVSEIIHETCSALWAKLQPKVLAAPTEAEWKRIAQGFETRWNFPHCISAIDGKHIAIQKPDGAGSEYFNYKHYHSIVLMAACDYRYAFTLVDIGAYGRESDGGVFAASEFGKKFEAGTMNVPLPSSITGSTTILPYVCIGDQGFPLKPYILRPYPDGGRNQLGLKERIYNYRLGRARRISENTFGIAAEKWRILRKPIIAHVETIKCIVQAIVCLHNYLIKERTDDYYHPSMVDQETEDGTIIPGSWRRSVPDATLFRRIEPLNRTNESRLAIKTRQQFCDFFSHEGAVPWQFSRMYD